jgi:hypothetical protein
LTDEDEEAASLSLRGMVNGGQKTEGQDSGRVLPDNRLYNP